ncbi:hypothetical protein V5799_031920 [Amblyomma americanum]|uniref:Uncharacterized protein n=1 Tax=Amblyomma americanum TaxID=6943 RepID=A0AAQ4DSN1_AMBAM
MYAECNGQFLCNFDVSGLYAGGADKRSGSVGDRNGVSSIALIFGTLHEAHFPRLSLGSMQDRGSGVSSALTMRRVYGWFGWGDLDAVSDIPRYYFLVTVLAGVAATKQLEFDSSSFGGRQSF